MKLFLQSLLPAIFIALVINYSAANPVAHAQEASPEASEVAEPSQNPEPSSSTEPSTAPSTEPTALPEPTSSALPEPSPTELPQPSQSITPVLPTPDPTVEPTSVPDPTQSPVAEPAQLNIGILSNHEEEPSPSPTPLAHLTFRTCLIPDTSTFRLQVRADYMPGEYRIEGANTGIVINFGSLDVGETAGSLDSNTYVLPEDTWTKRWYNGTRWQRSGGIPTTDVDQHIEAGAICEVDPDGQHTPYIGNTPYVSPSPSPTPPIGGRVTPPGKRSSLGNWVGNCEDKQFKVTMDLYENDTPSKDVEVTFTYKGSTHTAKTNENGRAETWFDKQGNDVVNASAPDYPSQSMFVTLPDNCVSATDQPGVGGLALLATPKPTVLAAATKREQAADVLGTTTLAYTGNADVLAAWGQLGAGVILVAGGIKRLFKKK